MRKIIIDTDPGIDDSFAITAASMYPDFNILGITTVAGNKGLDITTANALKMVKLNDIDCFVYKGSSESLMKQKVVKFSGVKLKKFSLSNSFNSPVSLTNDFSQASYSCKKYSILS